MTQKSLHWNGASIGDADALVENAADGIGYRLGNADYESPFVDLALRMLLNGTGNRGVLEGWTNELAVTAPGAVSPAVVDTGGAVVYGMPYENTVAVNVAVASPTSDTRIDRIVLRRDWAAQTIRITLIGGAEGGGAPAITQSPSPDGSGIYDIPLAQVSITTGGAITLTDEREFCQFCTVPVDNTLATAHFLNESADWITRQTRTKRLFIPAGDFEPATVLGFDRFSYGVGLVDYLQYVTGSTWTNTTVTEQGWIAGATDGYGWTATFKLPADYASGNVVAYVWWMDDCGTAMDFKWYTAWQSYASGAQMVQSVTDTETAITGTTTAGDVYRAAARAISGVTTSELIHYAVEMWKTAGTGDVLFLGLELEYTGYL